LKKKLANITALSSLIFGINAASANAPTSELKVTGVLTTTQSCTVIAPDGGVYDFGRVSASVVKPGTSTTALTPMKKTWMVNCDSAIHLGFMPVDNRTASASVVSPSIFGLGNVNGTGKIGHYTATMNNSTVDGVASNIKVDGISSVLAGTNLTTGKNHWWSTSNGNLSIGKLFTADITVNPMLGGTTTMGGPINDDVNLDGSMTMNFAFAI
jgi:Protein of unknown function (DUF1120)